jgi:hypothetical protein
MAIFLPVNVLPVNHKDLGMLGILAVQGKSLARQRLHNQGVAHHCTLDHGAEVGMV